MRFVYKNKEAAAERGRRAREAVLKLFDPLIVGSQMKDRLTKITSR
jgi:hypothetical protein